MSETSQIALAVERLEQGQLVAFPTETVYGLGGDARDPAAIERIFSQKGRPREHPVIVHLRKDAELAHWARDLHPAAWALSAAFWPGPLTLVLRRARGVLDEITGGQDTIGVRCPAHPLAQALLVAFAESDPRRALAAPSANRFGRISPTTAAHVRDEFGDAVMVLDGGSAPIGIESTIIDLSRMDREGPVMLRPGAIGAEELAAVLGVRPVSGDGMGPRASGTLAAHYAPRTPLRLVSAAELTAIPDGTAVWSYSVGALAGNELWRDAPTEPGAYARELYAMLRWFDDQRPLRIWVEAPPNEAAWDAVNDRLGRAAHGSGPG